MKKISLLFLSVVIWYMLPISFAIGRDLNQFYATDYDAFWKYWNMMKSEATSCNELPVTSLFFSNAVDTLKTSEITEANAEVIEKLALGNPECLLKALGRQTLDKQKAFIQNFLIHSTYHETSEIENSLNTVWDTQTYLEIKTIYYKLKNNI